MSLFVAPGEEGINRPGIGLAGVRVADVGGEELDEAAGSTPTGIGKALSGVRTISWFLRSATPSPFWRIDVT